MTASIRRWLARAVIPKAPRESSKRYVVPHQGNAEKARRAARLAAKAAKAKAGAK